MDLENVEASFRSDHVPHPPFNDASSTVKVHADVQLRYPYPTKQSFISDTLQLLYAMRGPYPSPIPHIHTLRRQDLPDEYRTHEALALFLATDSGDEVAVTTVRTTDSIRYIAAKNRLIGPDDLLAAELLTYAMRDPNRSVESLSRIVLGTSYPRINRCLAEAADVLLSYSEFADALHAYYTSPARLAKKTIFPPSCHYDETGVTLVKHMRRRGLHHLYPALMSLYKSIRERLISPHLPTPLPSTYEELSAACKKWRKLCADIVILVRSDFFERMTRPEEVTFTWTILMMEDLAILRYRLLHIALYQIGINIVMHFGEQHQAVMEKVEIRWAREPSSSRAEVMLSESPIDAARQCLGHANMLLQEEERFSAIIEGAPRWQTSVSSSIHPEVKLILHLLNDEPSFSRRRAGLYEYQGFACSQASCTACQTFITAINGKGAKEDMPFVLLSPIMPAPGPLDLDWKLTGLGGFEWCDNTVRDELNSVFTKVCKRRKLSQSPPVSPVSPREPVGQPQSEARTPSR